MKPIAPLMIEHRLIERMLSLFGKEHRKIGRTGIIDRDFLGTAVDFFRIYVDRFHHGKEEDILFRGVAGKPLAPEHRNTLNELIGEHERARPVVQKLGEAVRGPAPTPEAINGIAGLMEKILVWYPAHIQKEDKHFFIPAMTYLSPQEQAAMLEASREFDRNFIQQQYIEIIKELEERGRR